MWACNCACFADALCFADSSFGPEGARVISSALERNYTLKSLDIGGELTLAAMKVAAMICGRVIARVLLTRFALQRMVLGRRVHASYRVRLNATPRSPG
jgi:hypothetical protein